MLFLFAHYQGEAPSFQNEKEGAKLMSLVPHNRVLLALLGKLYLGSCVGQHLSYLPRPCYLSTNDKKKGTKILLTPYQVLLFTLPLPGT